MDFKAALQAEIEAKKRQFAKVSSSESSKNINKNWNSVKVSDLEKQRVEEYLEKQKALEEQRQVQ